MQFEYRSSHRYHKALGVLSVLLLTQATAQTPAAGNQTAPKVQGATVQLVSDVCPVVHAGDRIAFDWNPVFDPEGPVLGVGKVNLQFGRQEENGVNLLPRAVYSLGARKTPTSATATANGFYHVEITVPGERILPPGIYHLVDARVNAQVEPDYQGPAPQMTQSPVDSRYCFTMSSALQP